MPSWRGVQLKKYRDNFTFTFTFSLCSNAPPSEIVVRHPQS